MTTNTDTALCGCTEFGQWYVVDGEEVTLCANYATARALSKAKNYTLEA
jgi:hypothetical protein